MGYILAIGLWVLWPVLCYNLASGKGRDTGMAIFGGIIFSLFAVLYYATVPSLKGQGS